MVLIWAKKDDPLLYSPEEIQAINRYMLPTYLSEDIFIINKQPYVKKPVYSREGNTVEIYKGNGSKWYESSYTHYTDNLYVYQQYIEMPSIEIPLKGGTAKDYFEVHFEQGKILDHHKFSSKEIKKP